MEVILTNWPVFLMMVWTIYSFCKATHYHGQTVERWWLWSFLATLVQAVCLMFGGFFTIWGWPQWVYTILAVCGFGLFRKGGIYEEDVSIGGYVFAHTLLWILYYCGGFWFK